MSQSVAKCRSISKQQLLLATMCCKHNSCDIYDRLRHPTTQWKPGVSQDTKQMRSKTTKRKGIKTEDREIQNIELITSLRRLLLSILVCNFSDFEVQYPYNRLIKVRTEKGLTKKTQNQSVRTNDLKTGYQLQIS